MTKNDEKWAFSLIFNVEFWKDHKSYGVEGFTRVKHISWAAFHANMVTISMKSRTVRYLADTWFLSRFIGHFNIKGSKSGIFIQQMKPIISKGHSGKQFCFFSVFFGAFLHFKRYDHDVYMFLILQNIPERTVEADFWFEPSKKNFLIPEVAS